MSKIIKLTLVSCSIYVVLSIHSFNVYAGQPVDSTSNSTSEKYFYCPQHIDCIKDGNHGSCTFKTENPRYWDGIRSFSPYPEEAVTLDFFGVTSLFHSSKTEPVSCLYSGKGKFNQTYSMTIASVKERNLEALYGSQSNWTFVGDNAGCRSPDTHDIQSCPLKEQPALTIYNLNMTGGISVIINNRNITNILMSQYGKVTYDVAFADCPNSRECEIDFISPYGVTLGNVIVDPDDHMKILKINPTRPGYANILQVEQFNAVELGYVSK